MNVDEYLGNISIAPSNDATWLAKAKEGVDLLLTNARSAEIILYANWGCTFIHGIFAPVKGVSPPDHEDLLRCNVFADTSWRFEHVSGGGQPDRMYLALPLESPGCNSLIGGQKIIFSRHFSGVDKGYRPIEVSQQLVHSLGLYWVDEMHAFCRLDEEGDIKPVIKLSRRDKEEFVTILAEDLNQYMAVTDFALIQKFNFTRYSKGFDSWSNATRGEERHTDLAYKWGILPTASFASGVQIIRARVTRDELIKKNHRQTTEAKEYVSFKAQDWKNNRLAVISCAPEALSSYFEPESSLPFQITPAFFRPEVLQKYKADPEKYTLDDRSISSRAGWELTTFDVSEEGQVHTYLHYLGDLPYTEQLYWASFNEWPKGPISQRAMETDFEGVVSSVSDPLVELKYFIKELDELEPAWWKAREDDLHNALHYPLTTSVEEWSTAIMALDQIVVEGFKSNVLKQKLLERRIVFDPNFGSLKLLESLSAVATESISTAETLIQPLKAVHFLRTKVKGHATGSEKDEIVKRCRQENGSLKAHFRALVTDCCNCLKQLVSDVLTPSFSAPQPK